MISTGKFQILWQVTVTNIYCFPQLLKYNHGKGSTFF